VLRYAPFYHLCCELCMSHHGNYVEVEEDVLITAIMPHVDQPIG
jgi:hypothetical protein